MVNPVSYVKNVGKSFGYVAVDVFKEMNPAVTSFIENNKSFVEDVHTAIKERKENHSNATEKFIKNQYVQSASKALKNLKDDLKTGNWYNKERKEEYDNEAAKAMFGIDFDDMGFDDNFDFDDNDSTWDLNDLESSMDDVGENIANAVNTGTVRSAEYIGQVTERTTKLTMQHMTNLFGNVNVGLSNINAGISSITAVIEPFNSHMQNTATFFTKSTELQTKQVELLERLVENTSPAEKTVTRSNKKNRASDILDANGMLDISNYLDMVKDNIKDQFSMISGMMEMVGGGEEGGSATILDSMISSPIQIIMENVINTLIPQATKKAAEGLNKTIEGFFSSAFLKMADYTSDGSLFGDIFNKVKDVLGFRDSLKKTINPGEYQKGKVDFDGVTRQAIINVIPTYLSKIYSAVSGEEQDRYNYDSGRFVKLHNIKSEDKDIIKGSARSIVWDFEDSLKEFSMEQAGLSEKSIKEVQKALEDFISQRIERGGSFNATNPEQDAFKYGINTSSETGKILIDYLKSLSEGQAYLLTQLDKNVVENRERISDRYARIEKEGNNIINALYDDSISNKDKTSEFTKSSFNILNIKDQYNNNIFFYLQGIYQFTEGIFNNSTLLDGNGGGGRRGKGRKGKTSKFTSERKAQSTVNDIGVTPEPETEEEAKSTIYDPLTQYEYESMIFRLAKDPRVSEDEKSYNYYLSLSPEEQSELIRKLSKLDYEKRKRDAQPRTFIDKIKESKFTPKGVVSIIDNIQNIMAKPFESVNKILQDSESYIYKTLYGKNKDETNDEDPDNDEEKPKGFLGLIFYRTKKMFSKFGNWMNDKVFTPINEKLEKFREDGGIENAVKKIFAFFGLDYDGIKEKVTGFFDDLKDKILGQKEADGTRSGGLFSEIFNKTKENFGKVKDWIKDSFGSVASAFGFGKKAQAATGGQVEKTGMVAVSEGEYIIPAEYNPFYNKKVDKKKQVENENNVIKKFYGAFANGGTVGQDGDIPFNVFSNEKINNIFTNANNIKGNGGMDPRNHSKSKGMNSRFVDPNKPYVEMYDDTIIDKIKDFANKFLGEGDNRTPLGQSIDELYNAIHKVTGVFLDDEDKPEDPNSVRSKMSKVTQKVLEEMKVPDNISGAITGGLLGGGLSIFTGGLIAPPLGAAIGAAAGITIKSKVVQDALFGTDEEPGLLPNKVANFIKKELPSMAKFGTVGSIISLVPGIPGGPVTGLVLGSAIGFAKENNRLKTFLFGSEDEDKDDGLISKHIQKMVTKAFPRIGAGAIAGIGSTVLLGGPFGLVGNMMLGSAIGLASTTDQFQDAIFGKEDENGKRQGGLVGWIKDNIFKPLTDAFNPLVQSIKDIGKGFTKFIGRTVYNMFKETLGIPMYKFIEDNLLGPIGRFAKKIITSKFVTGIVSAPFKIVGGIGNFLRKGQIRGGTATYMTAEERINYRNEKRLGRDKLATMDEVLSTLTQNELTDYASQFRSVEGATKDAQSKAKQSLHKMSREMVSGDDGLSYKHTKRIMKMVRAQRYEDAEKYLVQYADQITPEQAQKVRSILSGQNGKDYLEYKGQLGEGEEKEASLYKDLSKKFGVRITPQNAWKYQDLVNSELKARTKENENKNVDTNEEETGLVLYNQQIEEEIKGTRVEVVSLLEKIQNTLYGIGKVGFGIADATVGGVARTGMDIAGGVANGAPHFTGSVAGFAAGKATGAARVGKGFIHNRVENILDAMAKDPELVDEIMAKDKNFFMEFLFPRIKQGAKNNFRTVKDDVKSVKRGVQSASGMAKEAATDTLHSAAEKAARAPGHFASGFQQHYRGNNPNPKPDQTVFVVDESGNVSDEAKTKSQMNRSKMRAKADAVGRNINNIKDTITGKNREDQMGSVENPETGEEEPKASFGGLVKKAGKVALSAGEQIVSAAGRGARNTANKAATAVVNKAKTMPRKAISSARTMATNVLRYVKAIPRKVLETGKKKIKDTVDYAKSAPGRLLKAAKQKAKDGVKYVLDTPNRMFKYVKNKGKETLEYIKETPGREFRKSKRRIAEGISKIIPTKILSNIKGNIAGKALNAKDFVVDTYNTGKDILGKVIKAPVNIFEAAVGAAQSTAQIATTIGKNITTFPNTIFSMLNALLGRDSSIMNGMYNIVALLSTDDYTDTYLGPKSNLIKLVNGILAKIPSIEDIINGNNVVTSPPLQLLTNEIPLAIGTTISDEGNKIDNKLALMLKYLYMSAVGVSSLGDKRNLFGTNTFNQLADSREEQKLIGGPTTNNQNQNLIGGPVADDDILDADYTELEDDSIKGKIGKLFNRTKKFFTDKNQTTYIADEDGNITPESKTEAQVLKDKIINKVIGKFEEPYTNPDQTVFIADENGNIEAQPKTKIQMFKDNVRAKIAATKPGKYFMTPDQKTFVADENGNIGINYKTKYEMFKDKIRARAVNNEITEPFANPDQTVFVADENGNIEAQPKTKIQMFGANARAKVTSGIENFIKYNPISDFISTEDDNPDYEILDQDGNVIKQTSKANALLYEKYKAVKEFFNNKKEDSDTEEVEDEASNNTYNKLKNLIDKKKKGEATEDEAPNQSAGKIGEYYYRSSPIGGMVKQELNNQGELVDVTNDNENRLLLAEEAQDREAKKSLADSVSGIGGKIGGIFSKLFSSDDDDEDKEEGFLSKILGGLGTLLLPVTSTIVKAIGTVVTTIGGIWLFNSAIKGKFDKLFKGIASLLPNNEASNSDNSTEGQEEITTTNSDGETVQLQQDENGNLVTDDDGNYVDSNGNAVDSSSKLTSTTTGSTFSQRLKQQTSRSIITKGGYKSLASKVFKTPIKIAKKIASTKVGQKVGSLISKGKNAITTNIKKKVSSIVSKVTSKFTSGSASSSTALTTVAVADNAAENLTKWGTKLKSIPFIGGKIATVVDALVAKLGPYLTKIINSKGVTQLTKIAGSATKLLPVVSWALLIYDFQSGYSDAKSILGITDSPTFWQKVMCGAIRALNRAIPFIGGLIPEKTLVNIFCETIAPLIGINVSELKGKREAATEEVEQYNEENGTSYTIEEYNKKVKGEYTIGEKVTNVIKSLAANVKSFFSGSSSSSSSSGSGSGVASYYGAGSGMKDTSDTSTTDSSVSQVDSKYANISYAGSDVATEGCAPAAASTIINSYLNGNTEYKDTDTMNSAINYAKKKGYTGDKGTSASYFGDMFSQYDIQSKYIKGTGTGEKVVDEIKAGKPTILLGKDKSNKTKTNSPFGPNDHYVVAKGFDDQGNIIIDDPETENSSAKYSKDILDNVSLAVTTDKSGSGSKARNRINHVHNTFAKYRNYTGAGTTDDNQATIWKYFKNKGCSDNAIAAMIGNFMVESSCNPAITQSGKGAFSADWVGIGIAQWTSTRKKNLKSKAEAKGKQWSDMGAQLDFLWEELHGSEKSSFKSFSGGVEGFLTSTNSVDSLCTFFCNKFERAGKANMTKRINYAKQAYSKFSGKSLDSIGGTDVSSSSSTTTTTTVSFPKYDLTDRQIKGLASIIHDEQPDLKGKLAEASLMANLTDIAGDSNATTDKLIAKATGGWFAGGKSDYNSASKADSDSVTAVKTAIVEGKRTVPRYVNEHDCFSDLTSVSTDGTDQTSNKKDHSIYVQHKTKIKNRYGSSGTFYTFPSDGSDPFYYTSDANREKWGDRYYDPDTLQPVGDTSTDSTTTDTTSTDSSSSSTSVSDLFSQLTSTAMKAAYGSELLSMFGFGEDSSSSTTDTTSTDSTTTDDSTVSTDTVSGLTGGAGTSKQQELVSWMKKWEGKCVYSQTGPRNPEKNSADCSSTVNAAYKKVFNVDIGGNTAAQLESSKLDTVEIDSHAQRGSYLSNSSGPNESNLQPGDILLYSRSFQPSRPYRVGHVEMYVGSGKRMGHPGPGKGPVTTDLQTGGNKYIMARRLKNVESYGSGSGISSYYGGGSGLDISSSTTKDTGTSNKLKDISSKLIKSNTNRSNKLKDISSKLIKSVNKDIKSNNNKVTILNPSTESKKAISNSSINDEVFKFTGSGSDLDLVSAFTDITSNSDITEASNKLKSNKDSSAQIATILSTIVKILNSMNTNTSKIDTIVELLKNYFTAKETTEAATNNAISASGTTGSTTDTELEKATQELITYLNKLAAS